jgi:hypothetical protein
VRERAFVWDEGERIGLSGGGGLCGGVCVWGGVCVCMCKGGGERRSELGMATLKFSKAPLKASNSFYSAYVFCGKNSLLASAHF